MHTPNTKHTLYTHTLNTHPKHTGLHTPLTPQTTPFIWLDEQTGSQLIYMAHPGREADGLVSGWLGAHASVCGWGMKCGVACATIRRNARGCVTNCFTSWLCVLSLCCVVFVSGGYAGVRPDGLHIDSHRDCIHAPGLKHVMCASWGDDNLGEHRQ